MTAAKLALSKTHLILQSRTCNLTSVSNRIHGTEKERTFVGNGGFPESRSLASTNAGSASHTLQRAASQEVVFFPHIHENGRGNSGWDALKDVDMLLPWSQVLQTTFLMLMRLAGHI